MELQCNETRIAQLLLACGANPNIKWLSSTPLLHVSSMYPHCS